MVCGWWPDNSARCGPFFFFVVRRPLHQPHTMKRSNAVHQASAIIHTHSGIGGKSAQTPTAHQNTAARVEPTQPDTHAFDQRQN